MATIRQLAAIPAVVALFATGIASAQQSGGSSTTPGQSGATTPGGAATPGARTGAPRTADRQRNDAKATLSRADQSFLKKAAENGLAEVESSKVAAEKAQNPEVKKFAQHMVDEHTKANQELKQLAQSKGVELPDSPSLIQRGKLKMLSSADGQDFDRRYAESMGVEAHRETIALFEKASKEARDPEVKAFATKTLPNLREHLQMAQSMQAATGATTSSRK